MFVAPAELITLTGRTRPSAQIKALNRMGIPWRQNADGAVVVLRSSVELTMSDARSTKHEPNWSSLNAPPPQR
jgi:hypothetical protein